MSHRRSVTEAAPAAPVSKYASFNPEVKKEDTTKVGTVELSYVDPASGKVRKKDVFMDPESWRARSENRFLISSDLVNLLMETQVTRNARFKTANSRLTETRVAYLVDLWRLRGISEKLLRCADEETSGQVTAQQEPAQVQFFAPEMYFDDRTLESLKSANDGFAAKLQSDAKRAQEKLQEMGGGSWKNLLFFCLKYIPVTELGQALMDALPDDLTRHIVENAITGGLRDQVDELLPTIQELEKEISACDARWDQVVEELGSQAQYVVQFNERFREADEKLQEPDPLLPPESESEQEKSTRHLDAVGGPAEGLSGGGPGQEEESDDDEDAETATTFTDDDNSSLVSFDWDTEEEIAKAMAEDPSGKPLTRKKLKQLKAKRKREAKIAKIKKEKEKRVAKVEAKKQGLITNLLARWEEKVATDEEEVKVLSEPLKKMEAETKNHIDEEFRKVGTEAKTLEAKAEKVQKKSEQVLEKSEELVQQVAVQEKEIEQETMEVQELVSEVKALPPPDPRIELLKKLKEDRKAIQERTKKCQQQVPKVKERMATIKVELRELLRQLGKKLKKDPDEEAGKGEEEEEEEVEVDEADKPYYLRKKLAQAAASKKKPFNEHHFLNKEDKLFVERSKKRAAEVNNKKVDNFLSYLNAARRSQEHSASEAPGESNLLPFREEFGGNSDERGDSVERALTAARRRLKAPKDEPLPAPGEGESRQARIARVQQRREALGTSLRGCADAFGRMLPNEGVLAELKPRLQQLFEQLRMDECLEEEEGDELDRQLEDASAALHGLIGEAVGLTETEQQASLNLGELRKLLSEVRSSQQKLQSELRALADHSSFSRSRHSQEEFGRPFDDLFLSSERISSNSPSPRPLASPLSSESIIGNAAGPRGTQKRKGGRGETAQGTRSEVVDFGFRPDGTGEESLENWSLFKVSKAGQSDSTGLGNTGSSSMGSRGMRSGNLGRSSGGDKFQQDPKAARLQRVAADCDFREYMSQIEQSSKDMWRSASAPEIKKGPSLPELVKKNQQKKEDPLSPAVTTSAKWRVGRGSPARNRSAKAKMAQTAASDAGWLRGGR